MLLRLLLDFYNIFMYKQFCFEFILKKQKSTLAESFSRNNCNVQEKCLLVLWEIEKRELNPVPRKNGVVNWREAHWSRRKDLWKKWKAKLTSVAIGDATATSLSCDFLWSSERGKIWHVPWASFKLSISPRHSMLFGTVLKKARTPQLC